jgi:tetratricopeptide (TPR) repeat protein
LLLVSRLFNSTPDAQAYNWKGNALYMLKRYEEAITAYEQAIQLDPKLAHAHNWKDNAVKLLRRTKGAKQLSEKSSAPWPQRVAGWFKRS